jgi:serine/threonine-protein kinase
VFTLRKILGETSSTPEYIATVPRRGYQFVAAVRECSRASAEGSRTARQEPAAGVPARVLHADAPRHAPKSLAILPFAALSVDRGDDYLGFGIADALITRLRRIPGATVRPTSAVRRYLSAPADPVATGRELGVDLVLQGAVQRAGERIGVTVQLLEVRDQASVWSNHFDEPLSGIFTVEDAIADRVTPALSPGMTDDARHIARHGPRSVAAHLACLRGRYGLNRLTDESVQDAIEQFEDAVASDPAYALAWAGLASCYRILASAGDVTPAREAMVVAKGRAAALKALELDEHLSEAHAALADLKFRWEWDWQGAELGYARAIQLDDGCVVARNSYGMYLAARGRTTEALDVIKRGLELDPLSPTTHTAVGRVLYFARRYDEAIDQYRRTLDLDANFADARFGLGLAYLQKSMYDEGIHEIECGYHRPGRRPIQLAALAYAFASAKRIAEAEQAFAELHEFQVRGDAQPVLLAYPCVALGAHDRALEWLEKGVEEHSALLAWLKVEPMFDPLRGDPRLADVMRRMRLAD